MKKVYLAIMMVFLSVFCFSQAANYQVVLVRYIHDGSMTYTYSLKGIKDHFENLSLRMDMTDTYQALKPVVQKIIDKQTGADALSVTFGILGGGAAVTGGVIMATTPVFKNNQFNPDHDAGMGLLFGGIAVGLFGAILPQIVGGVRDDDILKYINSFNTLNPENPLKV